MRLGVAVHVVAGPGGVLRHGVPVTRQLLCPASRQPRPLSWRDVPALRPPFSTRKAALYPTRRLCRKPFLPVQLRGVDRLLLHRQAGGGVCAEGDAMAAATAMLIVSTYSIARQAVVCAGRA